MTFHILCVQADSKHLEYCVCTAPSACETGDLETISDILTLDDVRGLKSTEMVNAKTTTFLMCLACMGLARSPTVPLLPSHASSSTATEAPLACPLYKLPASGVTVTVIPTMHCAWIVGQMAAAKAKVRTSIRLVGLTALV